MWINDIYSLLCKILIFNYNAEIFWTIILNKKPEYQLNFTIITTVSSLYFTFILFPFGNRNIIIIVVSFVMSSSNCRFTFFETYNSMTECFKMRLLLGWYIICYLLVFFSGAFLHILHVVASRHLTYQVSRSDPTHYNSTKSDPIPFEFSYACGTSGLQFYFRTVLYFPSHFLFFKIFFFYTLLLKSYRTLD